MHCYYTLLNVINIITEMSIWKNSLNNYKKILNKVYFIEGLPSISCSLHRIVFLKNTFKLIKKRKSNY